MNYDNSTILFGSIQLYPPQSLQSLKVRSAKALPDFKKIKKSHADDGKQRRHAGLFLRNKAGSFPHKAKWLLSD
jgi:hypothetical protein